jgi:hypothetical protein
MLLYVNISLCSMLPGIYMRRKISVTSGERINPVNKIHAEYLIPRNAKTKHCKIHGE